MGSGTGSLVERAEPLGVLRRWEAQQGRRLVDPSLAAWDDLDSEAVLLARGAWGPAVPSGTRYWSRRRYLSFGEDGAPERLIELQLLAAHQPSLRARHSDLLVAGSLGERFWVYALTSASDGDVHLRTLQDPARLAWDPASPAGALGDHDPLWVLPLSRVTAPPVLVSAA